MLLHAWEQDAKSLTNSFWGTCLLTDCQDFGSKPKPGVSVGHEVCFILGTNISFQHETLRQSGPTKINYR